MSRTLELRGVIPRDLSSVKWEKWLLAERITTAKEIGEVAGFGVNVQQCAVAVTMLEQPGKIPNGNAIGMMPFGKTEPWGWKAKTWTTVKPTGYALIREGAGGKMGVFFKFGCRRESLHLMMELVKRRRMFSGAVYAQKWGGGLAAKTMTAAFDATLRVVQAEW